MILNYGVPEHKLTEEAKRAMGGKVFLNNIEIKWAWFIDTERGVVKTYDVFGDGRTHYVQNTHIIPAGCTVERAGVMSVTKRGVVRFIPPPGGMDSKLIFVPTVLRSRTA